MFLLFQYASVVHCGHSERFRENILNPSLTHCQTKVRNYEVAQSEASHTSYMRYRLYEHLYQYCNRRIHYPRLPHYAFDMKANTMATIALVLLCGLVSSSICNAEGRMLLRMAQNRIDVIDTHRYSQHISILQQQQAHNASMTTLFLPCGGGASFSFMGSIEGKLISMQFRSPLLRLAQSNPSHTKAGLCQIMSQPYYYYEIAVQHKPCLMHIIRGIQSCMHSI